MSLEKTPSGIVIPKLRILHVDDEPRFSMLIKGMLQPVGHTVDTFSNPLVALDSLRANPRDMLITDGTMPELRGEEMAALLRQEQPELAIMLLSADVENHIHNPHLFDHTESKPFRMDALRLAVNRTYINAQKRLGRIS